MLETFLEVVEDKIILKKMVVGEITVLISGAVGIGGYMYNGTILPVAVLIGISTLIAMGLAITLTHQKPLVEQTPIYDK